MRTLLLFSLLVCGSVLAATEADHHEIKPAPATPVETTAAGAVYGARLPATMPAAVDLDTAAAHFDDHAGKPAAFRGRITEVCQKMGCWVVLSSEQGTLVRVNMHEHAFGVPKNASGPAIVYGTLSRTTATAEEIEHLKMDGASAPQNAELQIDAISVIIPDSV